MAQRALTAAWYALTATLLWAAAMIATSSNAQAQIAHIGFVEVLKNGVDGVLGMQGSTDVTVSPDGRHVYVASYSNGTVTVFTRNISTGRLVFEGTLNTPDLVSAYATEVSPDGKYVYVGTGGSTSNNVLVYARDATTGLLTFIQKNDGGVLGLQSKGFASLSISGDGKSVYALTNTVSGLVVFSRNTADGTLSLVEEHVDGVNDNLLGQEYSTTGPVSGIALSSDGAFAYVTSMQDNAVTVFARDANTGALTRVSTAVDGVDGVAGIRGAVSTVISPDQRYLYVSGTSDNSVVAFSRDETTGALTYLGKQTNGVDGVNSLLGVRALAASPDGRYVYASAFNDRTVTVFQKNDVTGLLSVAGFVRNGTDGVDGIAYASGITTDPLGKHLYAVGQQGSIAVFNLPIPSIVLSTTAQTADENGPAITLDPG
ncbi:MAG TPA: beta-propeller fold lactonase family protein, partial [Steroidobacter sp.]|nr:beta-propeller fold lactonase family protein [Steroidobacter sp.]